MRPCTVELPRTLSALTRLAVSDAQKVEALDDYVFDMGAWHESAPDGKCAVCLAGAIISQTLGAPHGDFVVPADYAEAVVRMPLRAVDSIRRGDLVHAADLLKAACTDAQENCLDTVSGLIRAEYDDDLGRAPWDIYLKAAELLEAVGL